jgi:hypothetical protein
MLFVSTNPKQQTLVDQLRSVLTQCQLGGMSIHIAYLYDTGQKRPILVFDGIEIKEEEKKNE